MSGAIESVLNIIRSCTGDHQPFYKMKDECRAMRSILLSAMDVLEDIQEDLRNSPDKAWLGKIGNPLRQIHLAAQSTEIIMKKCSDKSSPNQLRLALLTRDYAAKLESAGNEIKNALTKLVDLNLGSSTCEIICSSEDQLNVLILKLEKTDHSILDSIIEGVKSDAIKHIDQLQLKLEELGEFADLIEFQSQLDDIRENKNDIWDKKSETVDKLAKIILEQQTPGDKYRLAMKKLNAVHGVFFDASKAVQLLTEAAAAGHRDAQYQLGLMYDSGGHGVLEDEKKTIYWCRLAAQTGNVDAMMKLHFVHGRADKNKESLYWLTQAATNGNAEAQYKLGVTYDFGLEVPKDHKVALGWCMKAAQQGHSRAQQIVGMMYECGLGVDQDFAVASEWYEKATENGPDQSDSSEQDDAFNRSVDKSNLNSDLKTGDRETWRKDAKQLHSYRQAAEKGDIESMRKLASMFERGRGVARNFLLSFHWYLKAALKGDTESKLKVGELYESGRGVPKEKNKAFTWFQLARKDGNVDAIFKLGLWYQNKTNCSTSATAYFMEAAGKGHPAAQYHLGLAFESGSGTNQNDEEAASWFASSAKQGHVFGQLKLGMVYEEGRGFPQDPVKAAYWFRKASEQGNNTATKKIDRLQKREQWALPEICLGSLRKPE